jgi:hypothetical protein
LILNPVFQHFEASKWESDAGNLILSVKSLFSPISLK